MTSSMNQRRFYQQIILEHSKNLVNPGKTNPVDGYHREHNPMCGDTIELTIQLNPTGDRIEDIKFEGTGCANEKLFY
ncbi:iron-sulfur cluster assembly scaffold protein [Coleofasciculus chthonoplastes]|jgi:nitrogen fixation NifU-like protein|uniref:iron-sulfur cluster assembly scaffold protein n=1 Tax=Coleofasciculus chthonoplastes TaxID=64178 RepID=UPI0032FF3DAC